MIAFEKTLIPKNPIFCLSSGVDSVSACHLLARLGLVKEAYHFNHGTKQAGKMQIAAENFCEKHKISLIVKKTDQKLEREADFRNARVQFIKESERNFITGHHLQDTVESYFIKFLTGKAGHFPIPIYSKLGLGSVSRPFLLVNKESLRKYSKNNNLGEFIVEDESNHDPDFCRRNWIRNSIIPQFEEKQVGLEKIVRKMVLKEYSEWKKNLQNH